MDPSGLTASPATGDTGRAADDRPATGSATTPAPTTRQPAPKPTPAPKPCTDPELRLTVFPAQPAYLVGQAPVLRLQVRNVAPLPCTRDLGAALQEVLLYQATKRLWSSNDCYPEGQRDVELMRPGVVYTFSVTWSGLSSQPDCLGTRTRVGAGSYALVGRLGSLVSPRSPLTPAQPVLDVPLEDRRLGQPGQALPDPAGPGLADALDRLQVVHGRARAASAGCRSARPAGRRPSPGSRGTLASSR